MKMFSMGIKKNMNLFCAITCIVMGFRCFWLHGSCMRAIDGYIITNNKAVYDSLDILIKVYESDGHVAGTHKAELDNVGHYFLSSKGFDQNDCDNSCGKGTTPPKVEVIVKNTFVVDTLVDTVFNCSSFQFKNDDITLPEISIQY
jgi:hypothetical protein